MSLAELSIAAQIAKSKKKKILKPRLLLKVETDEINYVSVLL